MRTFNAAAAPQFPAFHQSKTYASSRVWRDSAAGDVAFHPLGSDRDKSKRAAAKIFHAIRRFERQTARTRTDAFGRRHCQGVIGRMGVMVAHTLLFDFLNHSSGRLDPSYAAIAHKACVSIRSVARAVASLKAAGVLNWVRRCSGSMVDGKFQLDQDTNAYAIVPPGPQWKGYRPEPPPPPPQKGTWGDHAPGGDHLTLAAEALRAGAAGAAGRILAAEAPKGTLPYLLARLKPAG